MEIDRNHLTQFARATMLGKRGENSRITEAVIRRVEASSGFDNKINRLEKRLQLTGEEDLRVEKLTSSILYAFMQPDPQAKIRKQTVR